MIIRDRRVVLGMVEGFIMDGVEVDCLLMYNGSTARMRGYLRHGMPTKDEILLGSDANLMNIYRYDIEMLVSGERPFILIGKSHHNEWYARQEAIAQGVHEDEGYEVL